MRACVLGVVLVASSLSFAGPLNPPAGPVGSTGRTLEEVRPSIPVQSLSGSTTATYFISQPGSYHLVDNIQSPGGGKFAVQVAVSDVTLDLNGFGIIGNGTETLAAIRVDGNACIVHSGRVSGWGAAGVQIATSGIVQGLLFDNVNGTTISASRGVQIRDCNFRVCQPLFLSSDVSMIGCHFRDMDEVIDSPDAKGVTILDTFIDGQNTVGTGAVIILGADSTLSRVTVSNEGLSGALLGERSRVEQCTFTGNTAGSGVNDGLEIGDGSIVTDTVISAYGDEGIVAKQFCKITGCSITACGGVGITTDFGNVIAGNVVGNNGSHGLVPGNGSLIEGNVVRLNDGSGIYAAADCDVRNNTLDSDDIVVISSDNVIDGNTLIDLVNSIRLEPGSAGNLVIRNRISTGTILDNSGGANTIAPTANSATIGTAGAYHNILY